MTRKRRKRKMIETPTPAQIRAARLEAGISQKRAGQALFVGTRTWQKWEFGERAMMPALWELFLLKIGKHELERIE